MLRWLYPHNNLSSTTLRLHVISIIMEINAIVSQESKAENKPMTWVKAHHATPGPLT